MTEGRRRGTRRTAGVMLLLSPLLATASLWAGGPPKDPPGERVLDEPSPVARRIQTLPLNQVQFQRLQQPQVVSDIPPSDVLRTIRVPAELETLVAQLDDPSYTRREEAMQRIRATPFEIDHVYAVLYRDTLSTEQRHRLVAVMREMITERPRGAVGINMRFEQAAPGQPGAVRVLELIPGLPAIEVLRRDDRIITVDGKPLTDREALIRFVQGKLPGETVRLAVRRPRRDRDGTPLQDEATGEPLYDEHDVELVLGSADKLDDYGPVRPSNILRYRQDKAAWATERFAARPKPIEIGK